jgi:hypothetical protein
MKSPWRIEFGFYALAFLLAVVLRFASLGSLPLSDSEAALALQALDLVRGGEVVLGPHPIYLLLTTSWMFLFGDATAVARFWPALAGSLLVIAPYFYRHVLGRRAALLLAFFLAVDPGLVALSRQAGSPILAVSFTVLALGVWLHGGQAWAGIFAGLALLGGPMIWPGILALGIAIWAVGPRDLLQPDAGVNVRWQRFLRFFLGTLLLAGTLFFFIPGGLSAMAESLPFYLQGWRVDSGQSLVLLLVAVLFYEFIPLIFGAAGLIYNRKDEIERFLGVWALVALLLALIPPGRQVAGLAWAVIPLWALAARQIDRLLKVPVFDRWPMLGQAVLSAAILTFISMDLVAITNQIRLQADTAPEWIALGGALLLLIATTMLVAWGWSGRVARYGLMGGFGFVLLVLTVASAWNAGGLSGRAYDEIWRGEPVFKDEDLLVETIQMLSKRNISQDYHLDVVVAGVPAPSLRWALRDLQDVQYAEILQSTSSPGVVITPDLPDLNLASTYRGQSFVLKEMVSWDLILPYEWLRWFYFRDAPVEKEPVILWARIDLFPGGDELPASELLPDDDSALP